MHRSLNVFLPCTLLVLCAPAALAQAHAPDSGAPAPAVVLDAASERFLVVHTAHDGDTRVVQGHLHSAHGAQLEDTSFELLEPTPRDGALSAAVDVETGSIALAWRTADGVHVAQLNAEGEQVRQATLPLAPRGSRVRLALHAGTVALVGSTAEGVEAWLLPPRGKAVSVQLGAGATPNLAAGDGGFLAVWTRDGEVVGQRLDARGRAGEAFPVSNLARVDDAGGPPAAVWADDRWLVVYPGAKRTLGQLLTPSGARLGTGDFTLGATAATGAPAVSWSPARREFAVAWTGEAGVRLQQLNADGAQRGADDAALGASAGPPAIACGAQGSLTVWVDASGQLASAFRSPPAAPAASGPTSGVYDGVFEFQPVTDGGADAYTLVRAGAALEVRATASGALLATTPFASLQRIRVLGSGDDDTLTVDCTAGDVVPPRGLDYAGLDQVHLEPGDVIAVRSAGGAVTAAGWNLNDGLLTVCGEELRYTGLEPVVVVGAGAGDMVTIVYGAPANTITRTDDATANDGVSLASDPGAEDIAYSNYGTLTLQGNAGNDTLDLQAGDALEITTVINLDGGADNDTITVRPTSAVVNVDGGTETDALTIDCLNLATTVSTTSVTVTGFGVINFVNVESLTLLNYVNQPPLNTLPAGPLGALQNTNTTINGLSVTDPDVSFEAFRVTVSVTAGTLDLTASGAAVLTGDLSASVTIDGTLADVSATLASGVVFTPPTGFSGAVTFTQLATDLGNNGTGGAQTDSDPLTLNVGPLNAPPVNTAPAAISLPAGGLFSFGTALNVTDPDVGNGDLRVTLSLPALSGTLRVTAAGAAAVTGNGTGSLQIQGRLADVSATLQSGVIYSAPTTGAGVTLTMTSDDLGNTGIGGSMTDTDLVAITLTSGGGGRKLQPPPTRVVIKKGKDCSLGAPTREGLESWLLLLLAAGLLLVRRSCAASPAAA